VSRENVDVVRASFEAFRGRDLVAFLSCFDAEVEYRSLSRVRAEGQGTGSEELTRQNNRREQWSV
jgi:ketosteroid isomerase-like protein